MSECVVPAFQVETVGFDSLDAVTKRLSFLVVLQRNLHLFDHGQSDIALYVKNVRRITIEPLGPDLQLIRSVYQLYGDPQSVRGSTYAALKEGIDTEFLAERKIGSPRDRASVFFPALATQLFRGWFKSRPRAEQAGRIASLLTRLRRVVGQG